jgi:hypothetical protein
MPDLVPQHIPLCLLLMKSLQRRFHLYLPCLAPFGGPLFLSLRLLLLQVLQRVLLLLLLLEQIPQLQHLALRLLQLLLSLQLNPRRTFSLLSFHLLLLGIQPLKLPEQHDVSLFLLLHLLLLLLLL